MLKMMFSTLLFLVVASAAQAETTVIKKCDVEIKMGEERAISSLMSIVSKDGKIVGEVTQKMGEDTVTRTENDVTITEASIRAGMTAESIDPYNNDLSEAELVIFHAMTVAADPILQMQSGVDLSKVRSVKIYRLGPQTKFGSASIVEAKDENGVLLGSFLGGFLVGACK